MLPLMHNNVVSLNTESVYSDITTFLVTLNNHSTEKYTSSANEYERDFKRFFMAMLGKNLNELQIKDLFFLPKDVQRFQSLMVEQGYKSKTINRNINSLSSLFSYFETNRYRFIAPDGEYIYIKANQFDVPKVDLKDEKSWGIFTDSEVKELIRLAKLLPSGGVGATGLQKSLAIEFASVTSFRLDAIVSLEKSNFRNENGTWVVKTIDKDEVHEKAIRTDLYERLMAQIPEGQSKVFTVSSRTLQRAIAELVKKMGLDEDRNLTFHSLKKYGITEVFAITNGNILETAAQGNHSSFETAMKYYMQASKDYSRMPCLLIGQEVDLSPLDELSHEELLNLIKNSHSGLKYQVLHQLKNTV